MLDNFKKKLNLIIKNAKNGSKKDLIILALPVFFTSVVIFVSIFSLIGNSGGNGKVDDKLDVEYNKDDIVIDTSKLTATILEETEDAGQEYIDETLFVGDSNTVRTMLYGHTTWDNVVAAVSMGIQHVDELKVAFFKGYDDGLTVPEAIKLIQPRRIVITYGTNNTLGWNTETFIEEYKLSLNLIKEAYPSAEIIINTVPPVDRQRENLAITMQTIDSFNVALAELAKEEGVKFLNSAEALKDAETGFAKKDYTIGDGVHLSKIGMQAMFDYIRTHASSTEDMRSKPLNLIPEREETPTGIINEDPLAVRGAKLTISFKVNDETLGYIDGEIEQKVKATLDTQTVYAREKTENGGVFTGWSVDYGSISSPSNYELVFNVPKVDESITHITITANFKKTGISILNAGKETSKVNMKTNQTLQLSVNDTSKEIEWTSKDSSIATIDNTGKITAVNAGTTTVVATIKGTNVSTTCEVIISKALESFTITGEKEMSFEKTQQLGLVVTPQDVSVNIGTAVWTSSDSSVATVSNTGVVTTLKKDGTSTITCTLEGKTAQFVVTVKTDKPTASPSPTPTSTPSPTPTATPNATPTPTVEPTKAPDVTTNPTAEPTQAPTAEPTQAPTAEPTQAPTAQPTQVPTAEPTSAPVTPEPTQEPASDPAPTEEPVE